MIQNGSNTNTIAGNFIGTNAAGTAAIANLGDGVAISVGTGNTLGGTTAATSKTLSLWKRELAVFRAAAARDRRVLRVPVPLAKTTTTPITWISKLDLLRQARRSRSQCPHARRDSRTTFDSGGLRPRLAGLDDE